MSRVTLRKNQAGNTIIIDILLTCKILVLQFAIQGTTDLKMFLTSIDRGCIGQNMHFV